jgi:hypothetical protein
MDFTIILLKSAKGLLQDMLIATSVALLPTLKAIWFSPSLLFSPAALSRTFMANVWVPFGDGIDENSRKIKEDLIGRHARGVVLDIGAGEFFALYHACSGLFRSDFTLIITHDVPCLKATDTLRRISIKNVSQLTSHSNPTLSCIHVSENERTHMDSTKRTERSSS